MENCKFAFSLKKEINPLVYVKNPDNRKDWIKVFIDTKILNKQYGDAWERIESTK